MIRKYAKFSHNNKQCHTVTVSLFFILITAITIFTLNTDGLMSIYGFISLIFTIPVLAFLAAASKFKRLYIN